MTNARMVTDDSVDIDRHLMFYAQSTTKGHIRQKEKVFLPQMKF